MDSGGVTTKDWFGGNMVQALWCRRAMGALGRWSWLLGFGGPQIQTAIVGGTMVYLWTDVFEYIIFNFIYIFIIYTYMYIYCTAHVFLRMYVSLLDFLWVVNTSYIHLRIWCILSLYILYDYICIYASKLFAIQKAIIIRLCLSQSGALSTVLGRLEAKDLSCKTSPFNAWILRFSSDSIPLGLKFVGWGMLPVEQRHISLERVIINSLSRRLRCSEG